MSFAVFTDSCSNLPGSLLQHFGIRVLPCSYTVDGKQIIYGGDIEAFDAHTYYELLRQGKRVTTSLLNTQVFLDHFRPALEQGLDVVYVGLSAGISGTYQAACIAAAELRDEFPERTVCPVDSMGAGFGTGLLACRAAELRDEGRSAAEATAVLEQEVQNLCEFFTVSDLMFLHRTGRVQAAAALVGTVLYVRGAIVPLVFGSVPFFTRQVESALAELDGGLIEAALSMGSSPLEIIFRVYLKESIAAIARGTTITAISLLNLTAMAGVVGAGGLGDFAVRYGHDRNMADITNVTVLVLVLIVCVIEFVGGRIVKKNTH